MLFFSATSCSLLPRAMRVTRSLWPKVLCGELVIGTRLIRWCRWQVPAHGVTATGRGASTVRARPDHIKIASRTFAPSQGGASHGQPSPRIFSRQERTLKTPQPENVPVRFCPSSVAGGQFRNPLGSLRKRAKASGGREICCEVPNCWNSCPKNKILWFLSHLEGRPKLSIAYT
jgi:hypothetical protein